MATYPFLVDLAWGVLNQFLKDWQSNPYAWGYEIDIQTELASRLQRVYQLVGRNSVRANYPNALLGLEGRQAWGRVCSQLPVRYHWKGTRALCRPDIVVLDDIPDPDSPPDAREEGTFPLLWVCEIKLNPRPGGDDGPEDYDIRKMRDLLEQGRSQYACWLTMYVRRAESGGGIRWDKREERLWQCTAELPPLASSS